jgi:hypothetical protein
MSGIDRAVAALEQDLLAAGARMVQRRRDQRRRVRLVMLVVLVLAVVTAGGVAGADGWLSSGPSAPAFAVPIFPASLHDGATIDVKAARQVASDGRSALFVAPASDGTYCMVAVTPDSMTDDSCTTAHEGIITDVPQHDGSDVLLGHWSSASHAVSLRLSAPGLATVSVPLSADGFFIKQLPSRAYIRQRAVLASVFADGHVGAGRDAVRFSGRGSDIPGPANPAPPPGYQPAPQGG